MLNYVKKTWEKRLGPLISDLPDFSTVINDLWPRIALLVVMEPGGDTGKKSKVQGIFHEVIDKKPSLSEDEVMISVTNIHFCGIEGFE